jgi:hypothetical protein
MIDMKNFIYSDVSLYTLYCSHNITFSNVYLNIIERCKKITLRTNIAHKFVTTKST